MPDTTPLAGIPIPSGTDADDVPAVWATAGGYLDSRVVLRATDTADRDARYSTAPDGAVVVSTADGSIWVRAAGTWLAAVIPTGDWQDCAIPPSLQGPVKVRVVYAGGKRQVHFKGQLSRASGDNFTAGQMAGGIMCTVPASLKPPDEGHNISMVITNSLTGDAFIPATRAEVSPVDGTVVVWGNQGGPTDGTYQDTAWLQFDGAYYWLD